MSRASTSAARSLLQPLNPSNRQRHASAIAALRLRLFSTTSCLVPKQIGSSPQQHPMAQTSSDQEANVPIPPPITHILETCLMVKDIAASTKFYKDVFNVEPFMSSVSSFSSPFHSPTHPRCRCLCSSPF